MRVGRRLVGRIARRPRGVPPVSLAPLERRLDDLAVLHGRTLALQLADRDVETLHDAEFKVFSQFGDDGIVEYLVRRVPARDDRFVEIGVEDYTEANTRFLLEHRNWRGLVVDSAAEHVERIRARESAWRYELTAVAARVDRDNVNDLLAEHGFDRALGLFSLDIDGNDYWVWEALEADPAIVVVEYNSVFGAERAVTIPYDPAFERARAHFSHLYWGASLAALAQLGERKEYALVGTNSAGNNAYFVRRELAAGLPAPTVAEAYVESRFRESRDEQGNFTFLTGHERLRAIGSLPVWDVAAELEVPLSELLPARERGGA